MSERWRLFVAIPIGDELRAALAGAIEAWRARPDLDGLRWSDPAGWHLTLLFLGATDPSNVAAIRDRLAGVAAAHEPHRLATGGLSGFPSAARARVAWYGVADPDGRLGGLARAVQSTLAPKEEAGRFRPHVTLARARQHVPPVDLRPWIASASPPAGTLEVGAMHLMRSHVGHGPARYESLAAVPVGERVGV